MNKYTLDDAIFFTLGLFSFSVVFSVTVVEAALLATLALFLVKKYRAGSLAAIRPALTSHPLFMPWLVYLCVCLLTSLTAYYPLKGLGQFNSDFLKYICLFTLLLTIKREHLPALSRFYIVAATLAAVIGIAQVAQLFPSVYGAASMRANALMNAVRYGEVMTIAFMLILSRLVIPAKGMLKNEQLFYKLAALPVFAAIILSQTRGACLGLITGVTVMACFSGSSSKRLMTYAALMVLTGMLTMTVSPAMRNRMLAMAGKEIPETSAGAPNVAINIRMGLWKLGLKMLQAHPVVGIGPDNVKKVFIRFQPEQIGYEKTWGSLHNLYIHQAAERGILGLGALLLLFWGMFAFALGRFKKAKCHYALWAVSALPAYYVMNLTEISFQHVHTAFAIFLALAFTAAATEEPLNG
ncbi:MAG: hypothetical protein A2285_08480 [Elusimicrobia bacterium RIFOXYA12_FULL_57_11]|nr:MAG: hypothetical protein A2285_08480 [Elusimicrobia bacterium RIFOXYA12_FULL_57_11]